ncbi:MAG: nucleotidyltransferase domain-containing protein [Gallionella sp.]
MRLTPTDIRLIREQVLSIAGERAKIWLFGSRLDDHAQGGDVDLMLELSEPIVQPALMAAQLAAVISRAMHGRRVDVVLCAPNLQRLPIHDVVFREGIVL